VGVSQWKSALSGGCSNLHCKSSDCIKGGQNPITHLCALPDPKLPLLVEEVIPRAGIEWDGEPGVGFTAKPARQQATWNTCVPSKW